jgi:hypothetical protein
VSTASRLAAAALASLLAQACGGSVTPTPVTVVVRGPGAVVSQITQGVVSAAPREVTPEFRDAPAPQPADTTPVADIEKRLADARKSYADADATRCQTLLEDDALLDQLFASGRRGYAARIYFWRAACAVVSGDKSRAERAAEQMAVLGLDLPDDVARASVEVEQLVLATGRVARAATPVAVEVVTNRAGAEVRVDGTTSNCAAPCRLSLLPGTHWLSAQLPGSIPSTKRVVVRTQQSVAIELQTASPALAGQQWLQAFSGSPAVESTASMSLLATSLRTRRLVYLAADERGAHVLRGTLVADGEVRARGERAVPTSTAAGSVAGSLFADLLADGRLIEVTPLYKRPLFWIIVGGVALGASAITWALLREPEQRTEIRF